MSQSKDDGSPRGAPAPKRRRVALACDSCRTRKSRCDGSRPKCSLCSDLGFDCIYTPPSTATNVIVQKDYLYNLEARVKRLEESLLTVKNDLSGLSSRVERDHEPGQAPNAECPVSSSMADFTGTEDSVDAMGAVTFADEEDSGFFGPSSNVAFIRHLTRAIAGSGKLQAAPTSNAQTSATCEGGFVSASRPPTPTSRREREPKQNTSSIFILPPEAETMYLIRRYFSDTGLLFPYIYPPTFLETYQQMVRENQTKVRRTWLGLLNMVLAMATITTLPGCASAETRLAESDVFYQRGLGLCGSEMLRGTSLEAVQYLLLMGQYLQSTQKSVQAWTIHGLAVKAALQLGLHSRDAARAFSPLEQEIRKRTWYGCVVLDRTLSMTFGRPAAIPNSYVKLELPSDYKLTDELPISNSQVDALGLAFFNSTITLYKQMWNTMELLYGQNLGCDSSLSVSQTIAHTFSIEQSVFSWERSLPDTLRLTSCESLRNDRSESATNLQSVTWKLRVILTLRYLNLRVLLHRPVLVKFLDSCSGLQTDAQELKLLQQMGLNSLQICADSAIEIIDLVHHVVSSTGWKQELLGAWWFSLYYTFNAALVIFGTIRVCRDESRTGASMPTLVDRAKSYPSRATAALLKLDTGNRMVDRCRLFLERFNSSLSTPEQNPLSSDSTTHFNLSGSGPMAFGGEMDYSPLGMEFGEFMMDGDLLSLMSRPDIPPQADLQ